MTISASRQKQAQQRQRVSPLSGEDLQKAKVFDDLAVGIANGSVREIQLSDDVAVGKVGQLVEAEEIARRRSRAQRVDQLGVGNAKDKRIDRSGRTVRYRIRLSLICSCVNGWRQ